MRFSRSQGGFIFFGYIVGFIGLQFILLSLYALYYQLTNGVTITDEVIMGPGVVISFISTLVVFLFFILILRDRLTYDIKRFRIELLLVIIIGFVSMLLFNIVSGLIYEKLGIEGTSQNQEYLESMIGNNPIMMLIPTAFLVPLIEEVLFRGVILEFFEKRLGLISGMVISSIFFGLMHVTDAPSLVFLPIYASLGGVFAIFYIKYDRNILVPIGIHMLNNLFSVLIIILSIIFG